MLQLGRKAPREVPEKARRDKERKVRGVMHKLHKFQAA